MIQYGINSFVFASPFQTKDLHFLDHAKKLGFDLFEIPIESIGDVDFDTGPRGLRADRPGRERVRRDGRQPRPVASRPGRSRKPASPI